VGGGYLSIVSSEHPISIHPSRGMELIHQNPTLQEPPILNPEGLWCIFVQVIGPFSLVSMPFLSLKGSSGQISALLCIQFSASPSAVPTHFDPMD